MSLVAVSADEGVWSELEPAWSQTLRNHHAPYVHMRELMPLVRAFKDWSPQKRDALLEDLEFLLGRYRNEPRIKRFSCSVDLEAHYKWAKIRNHPKPERLCTRVVFPEILEWYAGLPDKILDVMDVFFDQNETSMRHIHEDWKTKKFKKKHPVWGLIRIVAEADMRHTIPLQIADMAAWARNRIESKGHKQMDSFLRHAYIITNATLLWIHREVGEKAMAESTFPEEGIRAHHGSSKLQGQKDPA